MSLATSFTSLSRLAKAYVGCVVLLGSAAIVHSLYILSREPQPGWWLVLPALTLISGSITVKIPSTSATLSVSETFVFTAVLLFGPSAGTVTVALDGLIISLWLQRKNNEAYKAFFNMAAPSVAIWVASHLYFLTAGPYAHAPNLLVPELIAPILLLTVAYFLLNSFSIAAAIGLETHCSAFDVWRKNFLWLSLNYFGGASVAVLLSPISGGPYLLRSLAVIVPILVISYLTFKTAMGRVEDASRHIEQLNSLYLSTIETLASAIDAKDQITHGHIRRVQLYAVGLAKALGVREGPQLKAVEAAALLHDTGKLAVPEYILNKPGRLTAAEFEKMKLHAGVGADILSSIDFPYPVVPIVRHHHENWDGSGYPSGLKGPDIPIGARILAVVDCFDALTSDRPYRPKLGDPDALQILVERRGTMYDPLVVDTFLKIFAEIKTEEDDAQAASSGLNEIARSAKAPQEWTRAPALDDIAASSEEMLALYDLARALGSRTGLADAGDIIAKHLRRVVPASLCVFYLFEASSDELVAAHVTGSDGLWAEGLRVPVGQRIAGWVAANRRTIINSDPILDFGDAARSGKARLRSCLSTPLLADDVLVGVLSLYSANANAFSEDHRRIVEAAARQISRIVRDCAKCDREQSAFRDALTGLPNLERLRQLTSADMGLSPETSSQPLSLLFIDVDRLRQVNERAGRDAGDRVLAHVARGIRRALRGGDMLFRYAGDEFVVLLSETDGETAQAVANRIRTILGGSPFPLPDGSSLPILVTITIATHPIDGTSLIDLISAAQRKLIDVLPSTGDLAPGVH